MLELPLFSHAQDSIQKEKRPFEQQDLYDWLAIKRSKPRKPPKDNYMLLMPYISSNPTAGFMIGCGITYSFKYAKTDEHLSLITSNFSYSTNKLLNFNIKSSIYVMKERLILSGD